MPSSKFHVQIDADAFVELTQNSTLPYFLTDVSLKDSFVPESRKVIPLSDEEASVTYYLIFHKEKKYFG
jgi:hypothetical protein